MSRIEILHITSDGQFNGLKTEEDLIKAWGFYIYKTGEIMTLDDFKKTVEAAKVVNSKK